MFVAITSVGWRVEEECQDISRLTTARQNQSVVGMRTVAWFLEVSGGPEVDLSV